MKYQEMKFGTVDDVFKAYNAGQCDVLTADVSQLYALRLKLSKPEEHAILAVYGRRNNPMCAGPRRILQKEMVTGPFEKMLKIHVPVDVDGIAAAIGHGILSVILPKA